MKTEIAKVTIPWFSDALDCDLVVDVWLGGHWQSCDDEMKRLYNRDETFQPDFVLTGSVNETESPGTDWPRSERMEVVEELERKFVKRVYSDDDYGVEFCKRVKRIDQ